MPEMGQFSDAVDTSRAIRDRVPCGQLAALPASRPVNLSLLGDADRDRFVNA